jgi:hypothetical protein
MSCIDSVQNYKLRATYGGRKKEIINVKHCKRMASEKNREMNTQHILTKGEEFH